MPKAGSTGGEEEPEEGKGNPEEEEVVEEEEEEEEEDGGEEERTEKVDETAEDGEDTRGFLFAAGEDALLECDRLLNVFDIGVGGEGEKKEVRNVPKQNRGTDAENECDYTRCGIEWL